jgi:hypothetical protein
MVWLEKSDGFALSDETKSWNMIRGGQELKEVSTPCVGFRVTKEFTSPTLKRRFLPGMQGQVLQRHGNGVFVQVRDLFDAEGGLLKDWISQNAVEIGTKLYGTWEIDTCNIPRTSSRLTPDELKRLKDPQYQHLAVGISTFLKKLVDTKPESLTTEDFDILGG